MPSKAEMQEIRDSYKALPLREKRRLQKAATKRSRRNRAHADPAAAELIRQHKAAAKRPLALQAKTDLTLEPADALVALGAEDIGLKENLDRLRRILRSNSQQARTDQQAKRQRLYEDISQLSLPGGVAGAAHAAPLEAASRMRALPNSGFGVVEFHPAGLDLTQFALSRITQPVLDELRKDWEAVHKIHQHERSPALPAQASGPDAPERQRQHAQCQAAGMCLHKGLGRRVRHLAHEVGRSCLRAFPPKTSARLALKKGEVVLRLLSCIDDVWFHISWINLNSLQMSLLRLFPGSTDHVHAHRAAAAQDQALIVKDDQTWLMMWQQFSKLDLSVPISAEFWILHGQEHALLRQIRPAEQQARRLRIAAVEVFAGTLPRRRRRRRRRRQGDGQGASARGDGGAGSGVGSDRAGADAGSGGLRIPSRRRRRRRRRRQGDSQATVALAPALAPIELPPMLAQVALAPMLAQVALAPMLDQNVLAPALAQVALDLMLAPFLATKSRSKRRNTRRTRRRPIPSPNTPPVRHPLPLLLRLLPLPHRTRRSRLEVIIIIPPQQQQDSQDQGNRLHLLALQG